jgi:translocation and assembly module TamA
MEMTFLSLIFINSVAGSTLTINLAANLSDEQQQNIKENLSLYQFRESPLLDAGYVDSMKIKGVNEIQTMLQTFGYYKSKVTVSSEQQNGNFKVTYTMDLGPPVTVDKADIQIKGDGNQDKEITEWAASYPLKNGDVLLHSQYEQAKKTLLQLLRDRGYFSADLQAHKVAVNLDTLTANITFIVDTGPRYHFGETYYIQEDYDLGYLNRFLPYKKGELFHAGTLAELHKRLLKSQEFTSVEINPEVVNADENLRVPITVRLTPRKKWRFSAGLGYGTDGGVQGSAAVNKRRFTRRGHQAGADTTMSQTKQEAAVNYTIPASNPWSDFYNMRYGFTHEHTDDTERYTNTLAFKAVYELKILRNIFSLSFEDEQFLVGIDSKTRTQMLVPSIAAQYNPLEGTLSDRLKFDLYAEVRGSAEKLVSDVRFTQFISRGNLKYQLSKHWAVLSRYNVGLTDIADFNSLPVSYRFFAGGDYSVRGYDYNSLSPVDENGKRVGGRNLLVGSGELQYRFLKNWDIATFYDIGNAFNIGNTDLKQGAGFGFGWHYSLLTVRVYAANALDISDHPWKFHVLVGADL